MIIHQPKNTTLAMELAQEIYRNVIKAAIAVIVHDAGSTAANDFAKGLSAMYSLGFDEAKAGVTDETTSAVIEAYELGRLAGLAEAAAGIGAQ